MKRFMKNILVNASGSAWFQHLLERNVEYSQYLMGIGSGGSPESSGEGVLCEELGKRYENGRQPPVVFDVGSNRGQFIRLVMQNLSRMNVPCSVHAFEPSRETYGMLHDSLKGNEHLVLNNFGLGRQAGEFELYSDDIGSGLASLSRRRLDHFGIEVRRTEKVNIRTLDEYCGARGIERIDLLKVDVEGHELDVMAGGERMFRERRIAMTSFEIGGCNIDTRTYFQDFWYFLQEHGMRKICRITPSGRLALLGKYKEEYEQFRTTNFLALRSDA
jgi:FkbM family methyltransferase